MVLYFSIFSSLFWFLFFSWSFLKKLLFFSISPSNHICFLIFYVNFDSHSFDFFCLITKLFFLYNFTFLLNIKFIWYLNFDPHSFNCYFLKSFCIVEIFYLISSFNIWLIGNWTLWFFQIWCFGSNDPGYRFKGLYNSLYFLLSYSSLVIWVAGLTGYFGLDKPLLLRLQLTSFSC